MPEGRCVQPFRDRFSNLRVFDQALARLQCILQKSFRNPVAGMFGVVIDGRIEFGLRCLEENRFHASRRLASRARAWAMASSKSIAPISPRSYASPRRSASSTQAARISSSSSRLTSRRSARWARSARASVR